MTGRGIGLPYRMRLKLLPGMKLVHDDPSGKPIRKFIKTVLFKRLDRHISGRKPDSTAPVPAVRFKIWRIPRNRRKRYEPSEFRRIFRMTRHPLRLFLRCNPCQQRPERRRSHHFDPAMRRTGLNIVIAAILLVPVTGIQQFCKTAVFRKKSRLSGNLMDNPGGKRLLCGGIEKQDVPVSGIVVNNGSRKTAARRVVHAAPAAGPVITERRFLPLHRENRTHKGQDSAGAKRFEKPEHLLRIPLPEKDFLQTIPFSGDPVIFHLRPGKQRGIVRNMNLQRCFPSIKHGLIEIVQTFNPRKISGRILAVKRHKTGIPDPDAVTGKSLIHIGRLRRSGTFRHMVCNTCPCEFRKVRQFRQSLKHDTGMSGPVSVFFR